MGKIDEAGDAVRKIAGYLPYNPGPGIYSRLERAIQQMPENVRVQELPGLLKRYKDGVPGWELKETDLDSVIGGRPVVSRDELLAQVRERSPVYTHKEIVLGGNPPRRPAAPDGSEGDYDVPISVRQASPSSLGEGVHHGLPRYADYGHGGKDYTEILITQPGADGTSFSSHWQNGAKGIRESVAHARFDTHGDALRINELQSDLGIHNRKAREAAAQLDSQVAIPDNYASAGSELPFPLEDDWLDLFIKRLALEAARGGHRAIEIASPRAIADKVGGNIENYEHVYNKVAPGRLERLGRKMGGLTEESTSAGDGVLTPFAIARRNVTAEKQALRESATKMLGHGVDDYSSVGARGWRAFADMEHAADPEAYDAGLDTFGGRVIKMFDGDYGKLDIALPANDMYRNLVKYEGFTPEQAARLVGEAIYRAEGTASIRRSFLNVPQELQQSAPTGPARRYIMSDEMRRRIIEGGIGAAVAAPVLSDDELIQRLNQ